jgi:3-hydroxyisobutyrate dehydrogenase-like beta-hydroxyacid dehydrogenase
MDEQGNLAELKEANVMDIGFIGLGIMGSRMAANLVKAGYELTVYNRTEAKAATLLEQGARWAESPATAAAEADIVITMLSNPDAVETLALGEKGFLDALKPLALWMDCTTVNPSFTRRMAEAAKVRGVRFLDAPVAGTKGPAEQGTLTFLVGGGDEDVARCQPLFDAMGSRTAHTGENGTGTSLKMVLNLLLGQAMVAFSEGMALGEALGIPREMLLDILIGSAVVAPFVTGKRDLIETGEYEAHFPLQWMHKDMHLACLTAYEQGVALPAANAAKEIYALAKRDGLDYLDFSAVLEFLSPS